MIYLELFWSMFQVGLFSIGGGYVTLPLIHREIVELHGWLTPTEFTDIITIAEMTPGPIAINASTFVGIQVAGLPGAIVATFGCVLPSCLIVIVLAKIYYKYRNMDRLQHLLGGLRPAVVGMIASAGLTILTLALFRGGVFPASADDVNGISLAIFALGFILLRKYRPNPIHIILGTGALRLLLFFIFKI
ncbi:MAG: chromate transporter [Tissierellia bacterium]|nr:chromate transporter [Tissierellia bacterium]